MAPTKDLPISGDEKLAQRRAAEHDVLLREVDEGVRQDDLQHFVRRYGVLVGVVFVLALAGLGGGLWWNNHRAAVREQRSEDLIKAFDALGGNRLAEGTQDLAPLARDGGPAGSAIARLSLAAIALRQGRTAEAARDYDAVAQDNSVPGPYRQLATIRLVSMNFDQMKPEDMVARLKPLAQPGSPWFGNAGELMAMAYLKQGRNADAGQLLALIARDETQPQTLRSRTRQLAGLLGYDSVVDVDKTLGQLREEQAGASGSGPATPAPSQAAAAPSASPPSTPAQSTPAAPAP